MSDVSESERGIDYPDSTIGSEDRTETGSDTSTVVPKKFSIGGSDHEGDFTIPDSVSTWEGTDTATDDSNWSMEHYREDPKRPGTYITGKPAFLRELPLTDEDCKQIFASDFHPLWLKKWKVNPNASENFTSRDKLNECFRHRVFKNGDEFVLVQSCVRPDKSKYQVTKVAKVTDVDHKYFPSLHISISTTHLVINLQECHGPKQIIETFNGLAPNKKETSSAHKGWKDLVLRREGEDIGSLHDARNAYQVWGEQKELWEKRKVNAMPTPLGKTTPYDRRH